MGRGGGDSLTILRLDELGRGQRLEADVCVVGAGAAGLAIVGELLGSGRSALVVESGFEQPDPAIDELNRGETVGTFNGLLAGRARGLGGTMQLWPGQSLPLRPIDLEPRAWVPHSGWPIGWDELARFYPRAFTFLGLPEGVTERDIHRDFRIVPPRLDGSVLAPVFSAFSPVPNRARVLHEPLRASRDVQVVLGATAVGLDCNEPRTAVERVRLRSPSGGEATASARTFVLCAGGIENPRLLLASGLGGERDAVGRYFQDHAWSRVASVDARDPRRLQTAYGVLYRRGIRYHPKLALSAGAQERERVLGCSANFVFDADPETGSEASIRYYRSLRARRLPERPVRDAALIARDAPAVAAGLARRYLRGWSPAPRTAAVGLLLVAEQAPNPESRLTLSEHRDPFGMPQARVEWRIGDLERRTFEVATRLLGEELPRADVGIVVAEPADVLDGFHHMGATRMSDEPRNGVVDADCRVHGISNLFVAGSSVFPTAGFANPTLTIVALAIRLADHLRR